MGVPIQTPMGATGGAGTFTAIDNGAELTAIATAIGTSSAALIAEIERLRFTIASATTALTSIAENTKTTAGAVSDINSAIGSLSTAVHDASSTAQIAAANQVKKNNFDMAVTKQGLAKNGEEEPKQPPLKEQIKESVKDGMEMHSESKAAGFVTQKITDGIADIQKWITESEVYQGISSWIKRQKDTVVSAITPAGPKKTATDAAAAAGTPPIPGMGG